MSCPDRRIGLYVTPTEVQLAGWQDGRWTFRKLPPDTDLRQIVADEWGENRSARPVGRCEINLAFEGVPPDVSCWPTAWKRLIRVANEDGDGVVGLRVLESWNRPISQIRKLPVEEANAGGRNDPSTISGYLPAAVALILAPWVVILDQPLPRPVHFTADDLCRLPPLLRFTLSEVPFQPSPPDDPRLTMLREAWANLFDRAQDCLNLDGYDLDDSVATRLLMDTTADPVRCIPVQQTASLTAFLHEQSEWIKKWAGGLTANVVALRVETVELDKPRPPKMR